MLIWTLTFLLTLSNMLERKKNMLCQFDLNISYGLDLKVERQVMIYPLVIITHFQEGLKSYVKDESKLSFGSSWSYQNCVNITWKTSWNHMFICSTGWNHTWKTTKNCNYQNYHRYYPTILICLRSFETSWTWPECSCCLTWKITCTIELTSLTCFF